MFTNVLASDFDKFSKQLIRELGHSASSPVVTDAILTYMQENGVSNPNQFLRDNMDKFALAYTLGDPNLTANQKSELKETGAKSLTVFYSKHFKRPLSHYELRILYFDVPDSNDILRAHIFLHSL